MKLTSLNFLIVGTLLLLASCTPDKGAKTPEVKPEAAPPAVQGDSTKGGQVVESGKYHMELVPEKATDKTHLDFYLKIDATQKDIPDAKVSGEIVSPDGQQKPITFTYDAKDKHYAADVPSKAKGSYQLKITAKMGNDKADGRFKFDH
jgi:hypothetical protein